MRPEIALARPPGRRAGRWFIVQADFPNDAFAHVRHTKDGVTCGDPNPVVRELQPGVTMTSPPTPRCAVEDVFDGTWEEMVNLLADRFKITAPVAVSTVRVPAGFSFGVAPDVEAD